MVIGDSSVKSKSKSGCTLTIFGAVKSIQEVDRSGVIVSYTPGSLESVTKTGIT